MFLLNLGAGGGRTQTCNLLITRPTTSSHCYSGPRWRKRFVVAYIVVNGCQWGEFLWNTDDTHALNIYTAWFPRLTETVKHIHSHFQPKHAGFSRAHPRLSICGCCDEGASKRWRMYRWGLNLATWMTESSWNQKGTGVVLTRSIPSCNQKRY